MAETTASTSSFPASREMQDFNCPVCQEIFQTPVRTQSCQHLFCRKCFLMAVKASGAHCPLCRGAISRWERATPTRASDIELEMRSRSMECLYCGKQVKLSYMRLHYKSCKRYQEEFGTTSKYAKVQSSTYTTKPLEATYNCPLCPQQTLTRRALLDHCNFMHYFEVVKAVCPICTFLPWGDPIQATGNIVGHLNARHQFSYEDFMLINLWLCLDDTCLPECLP
ncbi:E3 ubiquitin-protein ligase RNF138 isoform X2 [Pseudophryne corroboree]|uniref:E3 ubiquitin-protein ligase RNF138 isoform X2 n=1 Tax=Pseudophryne corroboree TaxID=495146 RepID=UPI003081C82D